MTMATTFPRQNDGGSRARGHLVLRNSPSRCRPRLRISSSLCGERMKDGKFLSSVKQMWKWINQHVTSVGQKKSESPTGFEPMISQNTGRALYPLELRRMYGERGHILKHSINSNIDPQNKRSGETGGQGTLLSTIFRALSLGLKFRQHSLTGRSNSVFYEISLRQRN